VASLRRSKYWAPVGRVDNVYGDRNLFCSCLVLDHDARRASVHGVAVDLSPREWLLLDLLLAQQGKVVGKERIAQAWSVEAGEAGSTEVYIHRLRRKLEGSGLAIRTVRGLGYLLEPGTA
jgi:two-component system OmpR family response regulator